MLLQLIPWCRTVLTQNGLGLLSKVMQTFLALALLQLVFAPPFWLMCIAQMYLFKEKFSWHAE
jgi:hypothetical protein